ncbi:MAG TPA: type II toxin-antitoxin system prevent-host-death family antitoxin [Microthrixaceae bacterium]|nr:type II toxin-antitoxin system prevent-host-death family antitoxin [Microthrixaceae bacterium]
MIRRMWYQRLWLDRDSQKRHTDVMEAGIRDLRDHLSRYLDIVREGQEITVTDHGKAVALLVPLDRPRPLDRLIAEGLVTPANVTKRRRPSARIKAGGSVSDLVAEQRR